MDVESILSGLNKSLLSPYDLGVTIPEYLGDSCAGEILDELADYLALKHQIMPCSADVIAVAYLWFEGREPGVAIDISHLREQNYTELPYAVQVLSLSLRLTQESEAAEQTKEVA